MCSRLPSDYKETPEKVEEKVAVTIVGQIEYFVELVVQKNYCSFFCYTVIIKFY